MDLAKMMEEAYGIPHIRVSYFGVEDMGESLYAVASREGVQSTCIWGKPTRSRSGSPRVKDSIF